MTKLFISQPMRGRRMADIVRERKTLVADAAVALQEDEIAVLDTLFDDTPRRWPCWRGRWGSWPKRTR